MIGKLNQKVINIICACVTSFIILSKTWIMVMIFHIWNTHFRVPIEMFLSLIRINCITSKPLVESHCAHDVIIRHRVKTVKGILNFLLRTYTSLEWCCCSSWWIALPVHYLFLLESPRLKCQIVYIFWLDKIVFKLQLIKIKHLSYSLLYFVC